MKIALIQTSLIWGNVEENLRLCADRVAGCNGCDLILLPEMFTFGSMMAKVPREVADVEKKEVAGRFPEVQQKMQEWAMQRHAVVAGSTVYEENGIYYNRLIAAFPDGHSLFYDKRHCFRMGGEKEHFSGGNHHLVFDFRGVRIAAFICYDLRFPVWCRNTRGYDLAFFVANWPEARRQAWEVLLRARAVENQAYIAGVNCVGCDHNGILYAGDSFVADPWGNIRKKAREYEEETVMVECDMAALRDYRRRFAVLEDRDEFVIC